MFFIHLRICEENQFSETRIWLLTYIIPRVNTPTQPHKRKHSHLHCSPAVNPSWGSSYKCSTPACLARNSHHSCKMSLVVSRCTWKLVPLHIQSRVLRRQSRRRDVILADHDIFRENPSLFFSSNKRHRTHIERTQKSHIIFHFYFKFLLGEHIIPVAASISYFLQARRKIRSTIVCYVFFSLHARRGRNVLPKAFNRDRPNESATVFAV